MENTILSPTSVNRHIVADLYDIQAVNYYDQIENMKNLLYDAAMAAGMTIVAEAFYKFDPQGSSGALILSASHLTYHFWEEYSFMAVDIFCCGEEGDPSVALDCIIKALKPDLSKSKIIHLDRNFYVKVTP